MTWTLYQWCWRAASPLHLGWAPAGPLERCRYYLPARPLHGAIVSELARRRSPEGFPDYLKLGFELALNCRFTYLFPGSKVAGAVTAWLPEYRDGKGLVWIQHGGDAESPEVFGDREFRRRLTWTRASTAVDPATDSAREGTLRETECLHSSWLPMPTGPSGPVFLVGYVFLRNHGFKRQLQELSTLFVGGDQRYGLGRIELEQGSWVPVPAADGVWGCKAELANEDPEVLTGGPFGHARAEAAELKGARELLSGWEMRQQWEGAAAWLPGSRGPVRSWCIDTYGLWKVLGGREAEQQGMAAAQEGVESGREMAEQVR